VRVDDGGGDNCSVQFVTEVECDLPQRRVAGLGANDLDTMTRLQSATFRHACHVVTSVFSTSAIRNHTEMERITYKYKNNSLDHELAQFRVNLELDWNTKPRPRVEATLRHVDKYVAIFFELVVCKNTVRESKCAEEVIQCLIT